MQANSSISLLNHFSETNRLDFRTAPWKDLVQSLRPEFRTALGLSAQDDISVKRTLEHEGVDSAHLIRTTGGVPWLYPNVSIHRYQGEVWSHTQTPQLRLGAIASIMDSQKILDLVRLDHGQSFHELSSSPKLFWYFLPGSEESVAQDARLIYKTVVLDEAWPKQVTYYHDAETGERIAVISNIRHTRKRLVLRAQGEAEDNDKLFSLILHRQHSPNKPIPFEKNFRLAYSEIGCNPRRFRNARPRQESDIEKIPNRCKRIHERKLDDAAKAAWNSAGYFDSYVRNVFNYRGYDNKDSIYRSIINFEKKWNNAAYVNGLGVVLYGEAESQDMQHFSHSLDVSAHEWTHALIDHSANLEYQAEPGALNEAYADIIGKFVAMESGHSTETNWKTGQDLYRSGNRFLRNLASPEVAHLREYRYRNEICDSENDNCGVHENSGIIAKVHVKLAESIGRANVERIIKRVLLQFLQPASNFRDALAHTKRACEIEFGKRATECKAVERSFRSVGLF